MAYAPGPYPSVTTILAPWSNFDSVPPEILAKAADRGTRVHAACHAEIKGLWAVPEIDVAPFLQSFRSWLPYFEVIESEFELIDSTLGYMGHPDILGRFKGDKGLTLIDLKTPIAFNPLWRAQLAAYKQLAGTNGYKVDRTASLRLSRKGRMPILNELTGHIGVDLAGFMSALEAWKYFNSLKKGEY